MTSFASTSSPRRGPSIVGPVILILLGALLLLQNLGVVSWDVWQQIWRFWPVVLILLGVEVLAGRSSLGAAIVFGVLIALVAGFVGFFTVVAGNPSFGPPAWFARGPRVTEELRQPVDGATHASYRITTGAGTVRIAGLPAGDPHLFTGTVSHRGELRQRVEGTGNVQVELSVIGGFGIGGDDTGAANWDLALSHDVPADLRIETGAGESSLDLREVPVRTISLNNGAGATYLTLPESGFVQGEINGGVGQIVVTVPEGLAIQIEADHGIGAVEVDESRFEPTATGWRTRDYDQATNRAHLSVTTGVGAIDIR